MSAPRDWDTTNTTGLGFTRLKFPDNFYFLEGTQLFPFERPKEIVEAIILV